MKNKSIDLNNHLFEILERLNDDDLTSEELLQEIKRAKAVASIAKNIDDNAALSLDAEKLKIEHGNKIVSLPEMLEKKNVS
ncbi:MAG: hypothetical protein RR548_07290 [Carnobacterium sp.]|uniref:hypothetical protein n=1 Tax=Carnobacterium sp. TaxID=48221 RepID=UPI002FC9B6A0